MHVFIVSLRYCEQSVGRHIGRQVLATECPPQTRVLIPNATVEGKMMSHNKNIQEKIKKNNRSQAPEISKAILETSRWN